MHISRPLPMFGPVLHINGMVMCKHFIHNINHTAVGKFPKMIDLRVKHILSWAHEKLQFCEKDIHLPAIL